MDLTTRLTQTALIPAHPLALDATGQLDERAQRALSRYYLAAGADGFAVGVHTTQFELHDDPGMLGAVWTISREEAASDTVLVAGVSGETYAAVAEAERVRELGYHAVLLTSRGVADQSEDHLVDRARAVAGVLPTIGFYLQESVGGSYLSPSFWSRLFDIPTVVGVKVAPFDRYRTNDALRALIRHDRWQAITVLTGNDDSIVTDLVTPIRWRDRELHTTGGLLGQWAVGTHAARAVVDEAAAARKTGTVPADLLAVGSDLVTINAAVFDVANAFAGCVPGINELLRQQGLIPTSACLGTGVLSPGQAELISAVRADHPDLVDESFVAAHRDSWLS